MKHKIIKDKIETFYNYGESMEEKLQDIESKINELVDVVNELRDLNCQCFKCTPTK